LNNLAGASIARAETTADIKLRIGAASRAIVVGIFAIALGVTTLYAIGFSHSDLLHAAAHDIRHAAGFPCH
jgi:cobalt transporter subunit CbtB